MKKDLKQRPARPAREQTRQSAGGSGPAGGRMSVPGVFRLSGRRAGPGDWQSRIPQ